MIAYHKEQTSAERWRGFQITHTQAPGDKVEKVRGSHGFSTVCETLLNTMSFTQSSVCYRCLYNVIYSKFSMLQMCISGPQVAGSPVTVFTSENSPSETPMRVLPSQASQEPWGSRKQQFLSHSTEDQASFQVQVIILQEQVGPWKGGWGVRNSDCEGILPSKIL